MILQSLYEYYNKHLELPDSNMPREGFSREKISFCLEIDREGKLRKIVDLRKDNHAILMNVPAANGRTSGVLPNTLWDKTSYVLGITKAEKKNTDLYSIKESHFSAFKEHHLQLSKQYKNMELNSLCKFLTAWQPHEIQNYEFSEDLLDSNVIFSLHNERGYLHEYLSLSPLIKEQELLEEAKDDEGKKKTKKTKLQAKILNCLITGQETKVALTHPKIKGVRNAQQAGGSLVSFNATAFESYGKTQNENAPVSQKASTAYVNALNYLLDWDNKRNILIGDTHYLIWSEKPSETETLMYSLFGFQKTEKTEKEPDSIELNNKISSILLAIKNGKSVSDALVELDKSEINTCYYILGLSANNARIVQRYWQVSSLKDLAKHIDKFYKDFSIEKQFDFQETNPKPQSILLETALNREIKNISPNFSETLFKTIFAGHRFSESIYISLLERIRTEKAQKDSKQKFDVLNYLRAGTIKAYLTRNYFNIIGEIKMNLDKERKDIAYLLGRLFSVIEKAQKDALGAQINATVKDKFLGTACTNPNLVFPQLLKNVQNHIKKAEFGFKSEKAIAELMQDITDFPKTLSLQEQGLFFIGYYHQNNANYQKNEQPVSKHTETINE